jgi:hypothetical protein
MNLSSKKNTNGDVMIQYQRIKKQYDQDATSDGQENDDNKDGGGDELNEATVLTNIHHFSTILARKLNEVKQRNDQMAKLHTYKQQIIDVLVGMKTIEDNYVDMYQKNGFIDLMVERPTPKSTELLSCEYRGNVKLENNTADLSWVTNTMFMFKDEYVQSMYKICEEIDLQIMTKMNTINKITDYINAYKRILKSCDNPINHKIHHKYQCTVCYENEISICLMPCGHTFCTPCSEKLKKTCFSCNGDITEKTKMYMLGNYDNDVSQDTDEFDFKELPSASTPQLERWFSGANLRVRFTEVT